MRADGGESVLAHLLLVDLLAKIPSFMAVVPAAVVTVLVIGAAMGPAAASGIVPLTLAMVTWGYNMRLIYEDDKAETWVFLRALPIPARLAVSVRFLSTVIAILGYTVLVSLTAAALPHIAPRTSLPSSWGNVILAGIGVSLILTALLNAVYFRFGYQATASAMPYVFMVIFLPGMLVASPLKNTSAVRFLAKALSGAAFWAPAHRLVTATLGGATVGVLFGAGWAYAAWALSRREFL